MKRILLSVVLVFSLVAMAYAAVDLKSNGTSVGKVETLNITGATTTVTNKDAVIATDVVTTGMYIDGSLYLTGANGATGTSTLWLTQQDGGCSRCVVDNAGTTFSCSDATCPSGM